MIVPLFGFRAVKAEQLPVGFVQQHLPKSGGSVVKIKAILSHNVNDKANLLAERVYFGENETEEKISNYLVSIQFALTNFCQTSITYTDEANNIADSMIEPFALLSTQEKWLLIAWCRLHNTFRFFRLDRINKLAPRPVNNVSVWRGIFFAQLGMRRAKCGTF